MKNNLKTHLIKIGHARGVRLPKIWLDQLKFSDTVELVLQPTQLVIRPVRSARQGWAEQFSAMAAQGAAQGDDKLLNDSPLIASEQAEWEW